MTIDELFARHGAIVLDSSILIHTLEGTHPLAVAARAVIDGIESGRADAAIASVALVEVLAGPSRAGDDEGLERMDGDIWSIGGLAVVPLDRRIAVEAARARGEGRTLADAIHIATAKLSEATAFITNDRQIRSREGIDVIQLSDLEVSPGEQIDA